MKIAVVVPGFSRDAQDWAIPALQNLATTMTRRHEVHLFSLRYPAPGRYQLEQVVHHATGGGTRFGVASAAIVAATVRAIAAEHRRRPFDVIHAFWADEPGLVAVLAGRWLRRPTLVSLGGGELTHLPDIGYGTQASFIRRQLIRHVLAQATLLTAGSHYMARLVREQGVLAQRLHVAPLGVDARRFGPSPARCGAPFRLVQAAALSPVKDQRRLLEVVATARRQLPALQLAVAGDGPLQADLAQLAATLGISDNIRWHGAIPYAGMPAFLAQGDLYVQSSRHESQGLAVLEAMACGVPVIGTPVGVAVEVACRPTTVVVAELAAQIVVLARETSLAAAAGQAARDCIEQHYTLAAAGQRFEQLYGQISSKG